MAANSSPKDIAILTGSLDDLACIMMGVRERVIRMAARISDTPVDEALEVLVRKRIQTITPVDTLRVPAVTHRESPVYSSPPVPPTAAATPTRGKVPFFQNEMKISRLDAMRTWDPAVHCHARKRMGFCGKKQVKSDDAGDVSSPSRLCKQCGGIYAKYKAQISSGWRGFVTDPFLRDTNSKEYDSVKKTAEGNTYVTKEGIRVMCKWKHAKYYWAYYDESTGMVYYDNRTGTAIKKLPVDWDRGHPNDQSDPITSCSPDEIIDLREHLSAKGWVTEE